MPKRTRRHRPAREPPRRRRAQRRRTPLSSPERSPLRCWTSSPQSNPPEAQDRVRGRREVRDVDPAPRRGPPPGREGWSGPARRRWPGPRGGTSPARVAGPARCRPGSGARTARGCDTRDIGCAGSRWSRSWNAASKMMLVGSRIRKSCLVALLDPSGHRRSAPLDGDLELHADLRPLLGQGDRQRLGIVRREALQAEPAGYPASARRALALAGSNA